MFTKLFGTTGRQSAPMLETQNEGKTFRQLMGEPGAASSSKENASLSERARKEALQAKLVEIQAKHEPAEPEGDPIEDQEDIALVRYVFESKPHIMKQVLQSIIEDGLFKAPTDQGGVT